MPGTPALFLDRDGVINEELGYLYRAEDVRWVPGIFALCSRAVEAGYKLVVVTNQAGIGRGLYTQADLDALMDWMRAEFAARGLPLAGVYSCPYHPEHGVGEYKRDHPDRKPGPGMLLRAAGDLGLDLGRSLLVGDRCSDAAAARAAGVPRAYLLAGTEAELCSIPHIAIGSLAEVAL